jgi:hypothetical protein
MGQRTLAARDRSRDDDEHRCDGVFEAVGHLNRLD